MVGDLHAWSTWLATNVSFAGKLTDQPEVRYTKGGIARAMVRVAVSGRREQEPSFFTVVVWRDQAEHAAQSLAKGSRVVVMGRLQQRSWTAENGSARSVVEVVADELGPSLRGRQRLRLGRRGARASSQLDQSGDDAVAARHKGLRRALPLTTWRRRGAGSLREDDHAHGGHPGRKDEHEELDVVTVKRKRSPPT